ncbi:MAG TPA: replication-associated recombination protein A [Proteobacteria bacterium]|nr:replication-associated recombination protein A [bacterium BMS3Abin14]HDL54228.1 replication-associated recombination protein A [Pseudomonadota bacterium]
MKDADTGDLFRPTDKPDGWEAGRPLADRMRPISLDGFLGQKDLVGKDAVLRKMIEEDRLSSVIFWGPPGSGKTTLARLAAQWTDSQFLEYSAVTSGSREMKQVMTGARRLRRAVGRRTVLFVDEVHRFNRAQQDAFLPYVESGDVVLVGATTENPSFEVNAALLSRSKVFVFSPLADDQIRELLLRAAREDSELSSLNPDLSEEALETICRNADGDARRALTALELAVLVAEPTVEGRLKVGADEVLRAIQGKALAYDKTGEEHYNVISALHKSLRGSDPDASLYWLARMLEAGEDRRYILRRLARVAVEDIGMADPDALVQAVAARDAFDFMGPPEGDLVLAQLVVYLALAPKSNSIYRAWKMALGDVAGRPAYQVPLHIRNAPTALMRGLSYGKGYQYSHEMPYSLSVHSFFPEEFGERRYYNPGKAGKERAVAQRLKEIRDRISRLRGREKGGKG